LANQITDYNFRPIGMRVEISQKFEIYAKPIVNITNRLAAQQAHTSKAYA